MKCTWWHRSLLYSTMVIASAYSATCLANVLPLAQQPLQVTQPALADEQPLLTPDGTSVMASPAAAVPMMGHAVVQFATNLIGVKYRYGGNTPDTGLDCSGFIVYVFRAMLGLDLPHHAAAISTRGQTISQAELRPGDLVFFNTRGHKFSHAGIYIGNNKFIHAPRAGKAIQIAHMDLKYWTKRFNGARRLIFKKPNLTVLAPPLSPTLRHVTLRPRMADY